MDDLDYSLEERNFDLAMEDYNKYLQLQEKIRQIGVITRDDLAPFEKYLPPSASLESFDYLPSKTNAELIISMEAGRGIVMQIIAAIIAVIVGMVLSFSGNGGGGGADKEKAYTRFYDNAKNKQQSYQNSSSSNSYSSRNDEVKKAIFGDFSKFTYYCAVDQYGVNYLYDHYQEVNQLLLDINQKFIPSLISGIKDKQIEFKNSLDLKVLSTLFDTAYNLAKRDNLLISSELNLMVKNISNIDKNKLNYSEIHKLYVEGMTNWKNEANKNEMGVNKFPDPIAYLNSVISLKMGVTGYYKYRNCKALSKENKENYLHIIESIEKSTKALQKMVDEDNAKDGDTINIAPTFVKQLQTIYSILIIAKTYYHYLDICYDRGLKVLKNLDGFAVK